MRHVQVYLFALSFFFFFLEYHISFLSQTIERPSGNFFLNIGLRGPSLQIETLALFRDTKRCVFSSASAGERGFDIDAMAGSMCNVQVERVRRMDQKRAIEALFSTHPFRNHDSK